MLVIIISPTIKTSSHIAIMLPYKKHMDTMLRVGDTDLTQYIIWR